MERDNDLVRRLRWLILTRISLPLSRLSRGRDFCFKSLLDWEVAQKGIGRQQQTVHLFREKVLLHYRSVYLVGAQWCP